MATGGLLGSALKVCLISAFALYTIVPSPKSFTFCCSNSIFAAASRAGCTVPILIIEPGVEPKEPSAIESESLSAERRCAGRSLCESSTLALPDAPLTESGKKVSRPVSSETRRKAW